MTDTIVIWLGERLLIGSIQAVVLVSLVWLTCRVFRRIPAAAQAALWWLVALKLVLVFAPMPAVPVPVLPDFIRYTGPLVLKGPAVVTESEGVLRPSIEQIARPATVASASRRKAQRAGSIDLAFRALIPLWLVALCLQAVRLVLAHRHLRGIVARSLPWPGDDIGDLPARVGLRQSPPVRMSDAIDCPQVFGLWSPVVLLPAETMTALSEEERTMTLCHELMHIRRHDLLFGWIPACAERLFFFHPFARLGAREYVAARESACDVAAVRALGVEAGDYGRMLVRLGLGNARPALSVGGSPFSTSSLKRRLEMLETRRLSTLSGRWRWALIVLAAVLIPLQLVARTPEAPEISKPSFDLYQTLAGMWATVQGNQTTESKPDKSATPGPFVSVKGTVTATNPLDANAAVELENAELQFEADGELFQVEAKKLKLEKLEAKIEGGLQKERAIQLKVAALVEQAEQARRIQEEGERARIEEMRALVAKAREATAKTQEADAQANADKVKLLEQIARRARELEVAGAQEAARRVERQARAVTRAPQVTQQQRLQRLLEQLERLADEQKRLVEEIQLLQQQPRE